MSDDRSEDVVTGSEARRLLGAAAATIEVADPAPLTLTGLPEPRPHRRWSVLLAVAASVVLLASVAWVVAQQLGDGEQVPPQPAQSPTSGAHRYGDGQVPALVGYTEQEAREVLAGSGHRVVLEEQGGCLDPAGYVVGSVPTAGAELADGATVRLRVTRTDGDCLPPVHRSVWELVREARGLDGAAPRGDGRAGALRVLAELATRPAPDPDRTPVVLQLGEGYGDEDLRCLEALPGPGPGIRRVFVHVGWQPDEFVGLCPRPPVVQVDLDDSGRIAALAVRGERNAMADLTLLPGVTPARQGATGRFIAWARTGESPPPFADRVRRLTGGFAPPWVDEPADRSQWAGCSGLGFPDCGIDPVASVHRSRGDLEVVAGIPPCPGTGGLSGRWSDQSDVVRVSDPGFACDDWYVLLWIDEGGVIYGVM